MDLSISRLARHETFYVFMSTGIPDLENHKNNIDAIL
jgi:hypothetical protein